ncbi:amidohydrolase [Rhodobacteraceae bacterium N5(2021)]|uniref:Amidohydrolase n=1 Tax=Gymnodinialimonas phycosphaerae TaxID=2841589 RepID=A0A975YH15_9RHOB|nr:M20 aminoacylase family protein [Gymnodinialimonas phycosphaerae]MBY4892214.1 amidohydrolase [Gymnodinialimonas phycosphaerae]
MPVINSIAALAPEMKTWRRHLHAHPELNFDCHQTAAFITERLKAFGITDIHGGIATSGIVAIIDSGVPGPTIGLRADIDALPILEATGAAHASTIPGKMHACGHDGHTTMLLGAAKYLAETRNFKGRVALIFQPAEEDGGGGEVMVQEGAMDRFDIERVFAIHNVPGAPEGAFFTTPGPIMAAVDTVTVDITGKGGHGAYPQETIDPIPPAIAIAQAFGTIVSRNNRSLDDLVVSVTQIHSGTASNVTPDTAMLNGTVRTFDPVVQDMVERRMQEIVAGHAAAFNVEAKLTYERGYPATINDPDQTAFAVQVAREVVGDAAVVDDASKEMGAEDFAYMLQARPGAYLFLGAGEGAGLHHPQFDFNDDIAPIGASLFARLVETANPA